MNKQFISFAQIKDIQNPWTNALYKALLLFIVFGSLCAHTLSCMHTSKDFNYTEEELIEIFVYSYYIHDRQHILKLIDKYNIAWEIQQKAYLRGLNLLTKDPEKWKAFLHKSIDFYVNNPRDHVIKYFTIDERKDNHVGKLIETQKRPQNCIALSWSNTPEMRFFRRELYRNGKRVELEYHAEHYTGQSDLLVYKEIYENGKLHKTYFHAGKEL